MNEERPRLNESELIPFFDKLFPNGFAGADVLAEIAPDGWEKSPLLACFHPGPEQVFKERLQMHRNIARLTDKRREKNPDDPKLAPSPEPTLDEIRKDWQESPVNAVEEVTELIGQCLWDVFSDNHEVIAADGRIVDIGSFRGASAFLDEYLSKTPKEMFSMDYMRFYMGTIWISGRADLTPVYMMIFRRLKEMGANWEYHFPEIGIVDLSPLREQMEKPEEYSPSESFGKEQEEKERQAELDKMRADLAAGNQEARREAMDRPPPATIVAYQQIFGRDPKGWPPA
jgi:hypothetical protein